MAFQQCSEQEDDLSCRNSGEWASALSSRVRDTTAQLSILGVYSSRLPSAKEEENMTVRELQKMPSACSTYFCMLSIKMSPAL